MQKLKQFIALNPVGILSVGLGLILGWIFLTKQLEIFEPKPSENLINLVPIPFTNLPGWNNDTISDILPAIKNSCRLYLKMDQERILSSSIWLVKAKDWQPICQNIEAVDANFAATAAFLEYWFQVFEMQPNIQIPGLFTGYYEPKIAGARSADDQYKFPLYGLPKDLITIDLGKFRSEWQGQQIIGRFVNQRFEPYHTRESIAKGALRNQGYEIVWLRDNIDGFFLEIQGSGVISLPDGQELRVGYAGKNGHPYRAIGAKLIEEGVLKREEVSLQSIRAWLQANPDQQQRVMNFNPSYVFFKLQQGVTGAVGAQNTVLTAGRSMAVDPAYIPLGTLLWLDTTWPSPMRQETQDKNRLKLQRLMIAQDTGGAIKGPIRGDIFFGTGDEAGEIAGYMKQSGKYYIILPKTVMPVNQILNTKNNK
ncbi:MAG: MltA domain-containing protein [Alphaproteobacteria bacterium]|nr:MltA domain-containing protein [Alphaproteobacteria bacterium]